MTLRRRLYTKLAAVLLGLFLLVGLLFLGIAGVSMDMYQREVTQKLNRDLAAHIAAEAPLLRAGRVNRPALEVLFHQLMAVNPAIEVYLLNPQGRVLAYSAPPGKVRRNAVDLIPIRHYLGGSSALPIFGDDPRQTAERKIFSAARVPDSGPLEGYVYVILGGEDYDSLLSLLQGSFIVKLGLAAFAASLLFVLFTGLTLFAALTRRLRRLTTTLEQFRASDFTHAQPFNPGDAEGDEIDRLSYSFNMMAARIRQQLRGLQDSDRLRRELVANVSHDLRTPLAAVQGYVETLLLQHERLDPMERRRYLEIAGKHAARLNHLVSELFELAKLDANQIKPHCERFPIAELMQDVAQTFRLAAEGRQVRLEVALPEDPPQVSADIGLMARVFGNLIENSLRYTPAGGRVLLSLTTEKMAAAIRLSDTGCGIAPEDLPHVFERFYRARQDPTQHSNGGGLGLAIVQRILELHGSHIQVQSTLKIGTTFAFQLPLSD